VTNPYAPGGLGRENVEVTLWGYPEPEAGQTNTATDPTRLDTQKTDSEGKFEFELPYFLTGYTDYELEILAVPTDNAGEDASPFGFLYDTPEGLTATVDDDSTLWVTLPALDLEATDAYTLTIEDTVNHPVQVVVTGPGEEDVFGGYEFTLRIREVGGMVDYFVETVDRQIKEVLPPLEYQVSVVDVNKRDAFSMAVLDYFRSRVLTVDNQEEHLNVLRAQREATTYETETHYLRYNERTAVAITGMESVLQTCNDEKLYVMTASPSNEDDANYALMVTVSPTQTINGNPVDVTSGFMVAKFSGGYLYDRADNADTQAATYLNDTLDFEDGIWESLVIVPKTPNLVFPYKQLLEVYYYDENSNYQGSAQREILVTGQNALPGADVFVLDDESTKVPLYVLRDPPGDQSYSYVNKGSALNVNLQRRMESTMDNALGLELKGEIGWLKTQYNLKAYYNRSSNTTLGESFTLDFTENISTAGAASSSENIEGYLDGPEADVIVGMDLILAYSMTEVLSFESCSPKKTRELSVSPNRIKTMWAYTRSQIENSIRYYKEVAEGNTYEVTVSGGGSADEVIEDIGLAADAFEKVLQEVDTKYTPLCEMCEFIQDFDFDGDYYLSLWESLKNALDIDMYGYVEDIRNFCKQGSYYENNSCSTKPLTELMVEWDQSYRDAYETAYRKYLAIREIERLFNRYGPHPDDYAADVMHSLNDKLSFYEPIENITFSAGSKVTRTSTSGAQSTSGLGHTGTIGISTITKVGYKNSLDVDFWFGVGAGTKVGGSDLAFEISGIIETTVKHQGTYSLNEGASTSFTTGYVLDDNDEGDHFSVDVLQGGEWGETSLSNYFSLMGGRSSCPYEKGTFPRDMPTLQIMDTDGTLLPTQYFDLNPAAKHGVPVAISSGNAFGESRFVSLVTPLGTNQDGMKLEVAGNNLSPTGGATFLVAPDQVTYATLYASQGGSPVYDFEDIELLVKPKCAVGDFFEFDRIFDTVGMEFHFRKPISPIALSTPQGSWFINDEAGTDTESTTFKLSGYDVEQLGHSMKEVTLQYKRSNETVWTNMKSLIDPFEPEGEEQVIAWVETDVLSVDYLLGYYEKMRNTYPEPEYPFVWEIPFDLLDGTYLVRAMLVHENGSVGYSNLLSGTVDRTHPMVAGMPAPADGLLAETDEVSIGFSELIDIPVVLADAANVSVRVLDEDGLGAVLLTASDYTVTANKNKVSVAMTEAIRLAYDGRTVEVTVTGIQDKVGNLSDPVSHTWSFQLDYRKQSPSPVNLAGPDPLWINAATANSVIDFTLSGYDVYEASYSLINLALEYRPADSDTWTQAASVTAATLRNDF
ncbi:MAG TPA: hypothetical protein DCR93_15175, partial [Cytophagales bacterium]|nr:hypothetical protein [Cytophagales bacterium]